MEMQDILLYLTLVAYFGSTALWLAFFLAQRESYIAALKPTKRLISEAGAEFC